MKRTISISMLKMGVTEEEKVASNRYVLVYVGSFNSATHVEEG